MNLGRWWLNRRNHSFSAVQINSQIYQSFYIIKRSLDIANKHAVGNLKPGQKSAVEFD